jgi:iron complex transport system substrate-binding protein
VGDVLGVPDVADKEIEYYLDVLSEVEETVAKIPESERVGVYYAEGSNGLSTDPSGSCHSQLIDICGGINVAECEITSGSGQTEVTKESVLKWNPEAVITTSAEFYDFIFTDDSWKEVPAVQTNRVYLAPRYPYNWFDRPPGVNRIVGLPWTAHVLYPDYFPEEWFEDRVKEYYSIFYHYELSDEDLETLLSG